MTITNVVFFGVGFVLGGVIGIAGYIVYAIYKVNGEVLASLDNLD